jgi:ubiquinone/menaquinone biosynthesis C-methylase UbiE
MTYNSYQSPKTISSLQQEAREITENRDIISAWEQIKDNSCKNNISLVADLIDDIFKLAASKRNPQFSQDNKIIAQELSVSLLGILNEFNLPSTLQKIINSSAILKVLPLFIDAYVAAGMKFCHYSINHPFFCEQERDIVLFWGRHKINLSREKVYSLFSSQGIYSQFHSRISFLTPVGVEPDFNKTIKLGNLHIPLQKIPKEYFCAEAKWESYDYRFRKQIATEVTSFINNNPEIGQGKKRAIIDIGGGNAELAHLLAQEANLPQDVVVVVVDNNQQMVQEGRRKIQELGLGQKVLFPSLNNEPPQQIKEIAAQKEIIGVVSSYAQGAMSPEVLKTIYRAAYDHLITGGQFINCDFSLPPEQGFNNPQANYFFYNMHSNLTKEMQQRYQNWGHQAENISILKQYFQQELGIKEIKDQYKLTAFTYLPLFLGRKYFYCTLFPGAIHNKFSFIK